MLFEGGGNPPEIGDMVGGAPYNFSKISEKLLEIETNLVRGGGGEGVVGGAEKWAIWRSNIRIWTFYPRTIAAHTLGTTDTLTGNFGRYFSQQCILHLFFVLIDVK